MPVAISCVTLPVDDLPKSLAFYQNVMGFQPDEQDEDHAAFDVDGVFRPCAVSFAHRQILMMNESGVWNCWLQTPGACVGSPEWVITTGVNTNA